MVRVKICGITNVEDALAAAEAGADALGFIFVPGTPRYIDIERARGIVANLPPFVSRVGVFLNEPAEKVNEVAAAIGLNYAQLHGDESPAYCRTIAVPVIKSIRVVDDGSFPETGQYQVSAFLLDTFVEGMAGGTGKVFDWSIARQARRIGPIILSGGLNPGNVAEAVRAVRPFAVDVSSGVESSPGRKDIRKLTVFIQAARSV